MIQPPLISVIIPTFNRAGPVCRAIASVLGQSYPRYEILVMDDGSTDDTRTAVGSLKSDRICYVWGENSGGPAAPRNRGLRMAQGEYVAFLDSDDWWHRDKLAVSWQYLRAGADVVFHDLYWITRPGQRFPLFRSRTRALRKPVYRDLLRGGNGLSNSSVVLRRELLLAVDGFNENPGLVAAEDYEAWLRVAKLTDRFVRIPRVLGFYWAGGGNISNPRQVLRYVEEIRQRHVQGGAAPAEASDHCWCDFAKGRAHFLLGQHALSAQALRQVPLRRVSTLMCLKTCWMQGMIKWQGWGRTARQ